MSPENGSAPGGALSLEEDEPAPRVPHRSDIVSPCRCCHVQFLGHRDDVAVCEICRLLLEAVEELRADFARQIEQALAEHHAHHERRSVASGLDLDVLDRAK